MTQEEFSKKLAAKISSLKVTDILYEVTTIAHSDMGDRLFTNGIMGNGNKIGTYSTKPMYANKATFKNTGPFKPQGKNDKKRVFKNKQPRKSMYLPNGYKQLKQIQGYESAFVNLTYSADLRRDFDTHLVVDGQRVVVKLTRVLNQLKAEGLTKKYGATLFRHTKQEVEFIKKEVTARIKEALI